MSAQLQLIPGGAAALARQLTGLALEEEQPDTAELIVVLYRGGLLDYEEIVTTVAPVCAGLTAAQVRGIITRRVTAEELEEVVKRAGLLVVAEGIVQAREMIASRPDAKQMGGLAMLVKSVNEVVQLRSGKATRISKQEVDETDEFEHFRQLALAEQRQGALEAEVVADGQSAGNTPEESA